MSESPKNHSKIDNLGDKANSRGFDKLGQPDAELKRQGWAEKKQGQDLAKLILKLKFKGTKDSKIKEAAAEYYGVPEDDISVEQIMLFRQAEKAIQKADTAAFKAVMERAHGQPKQEIEHSVDAPFDLTLKISSSKPDEG